MPRLYVLPEAPGDEPLELTDRLVLVGREPDCLLQVEDPNISKHHALLVKAGDTYEVYDLHSVNGSYVNDERIATAKLKDDDQIQFGPAKFRFESRPLAPKKMGLKLAASAVPAAAAAPAAAPAAEPAAPAAAGRRLGLKRGPASTPPPMPPAAPTPTTTPKPAIPLSSAGVPVTPVPSSGPKPAIPLAPGAPVPTATPKPAIPLSPAGGLGIGLKRAVPPAVAAPADAKETQPNAAPVAGSEPPPVVEGVGEEEPPPLPPPAPAGDEPPRERTLRMEPRGGGEIRLKLKR